MSPQTGVRIAVVTVVAILLGVAATQIVKIHPVAGNEYAVVETWRDGVLPEPLPPKTYVRFPGFYYSFYNYDMSQRVYVMNDEAEEIDSVRGRRRDSYTVQSAEGQDMKISLEMAWRRDPQKLVQMHKTARNNVEETVIRPVLLRVVKDEATTREAIEAYAGKGLVELQNAIYTGLRESAEYQEVGILVENFAIKDIELDEDYRSEIRNRQIAFQRELRAKQEETAALAEAQRAKAEAQADYERALVEAERDKQVGVLEAQKLAEQEVLAAEAAKKQVVLKAEADKESQVLAAEAEKESGELKAAAILALGQAEAEAQKLQLQAYAVEGADAFVKIEVARSMADAFRNISGYLPGDMQINVLSSSFMRAIESIGSAGAKPVPAK